MGIEIETPMLANELKKSSLACLWFMFLTFPIMVIRVNTVEKIIEWRWANLFYVGIGSFVLSALWRYLIRRKEQGIHRTEVDGIARVTLSQRLLSDRRWTAGNRPRRAERRRVTGGRRCGKFSRHGIAARRIGEPGIAGPRTVAPSPEPA